ncbi:carboxylate-amine ligase [Nocardia brasiliensis]|uniref:carboxylate-amine ligase n=1 Tax=Nocardia brasiliensis TaxID=37326 RepID=UPI002455EB84|nr:glutamate--cysteine ligase [Nocardia brasiliensis]
MSSELPTFGVEEEFLIVDPRTGEPLPVAAEVVKSGRDSGVNLQPELARYQVETATSVHTDLELLLGDLRAMRGAAAACVDAKGGRLLAAGIPLTESGGMAVVDQPRYMRIADEFGLIAGEQAVCGCHIHVAVPNRGAAIQVGNHIRPWLPVLLALTANSAIYRGAYTGYASWRNIMWRRWPVSGPPPYFHTTADYDARVDMMLASGAILDTRMVYWDVRPSVTYPTVEIRVSDVPVTAEETAVLAGLVRALVMSASVSIREGRPAPALPNGALAASYWKAARFGLGGDGFDAQTASVLPARVQLDLLLDHLDPMLTASGDRSFVEQTLETVLQRGNGAARQLDALLSGATVQEIVAELADATLDGVHV